MGETLRTEQKHGGDTLEEVNAAEAEKLPCYLLNLIGSGDDLQPRYFMLNGLENRRFFHCADKKAPRIFRMSTEELQDLGEAEDLGAITDQRTSYKDTVRVADNRTDAVEQSAKEAMKYTATDWTYNSYKQALTERQMILLRMMCLTRNYPLFISAMLLKVPERSDASRFKFRVVGWLKQLAWFY